VFSADLCKGCERLFLWHGMGKQSINTLMLLDVLECFGGVATGFKSDCMYCKLLKLLDEFKFAMRMCKYMCKKWPIPALSL
jgi:hypothetical protein